MCELGRKIGQIVKEKRAALNMSVTELTTVVGASVPTTYYIESGHVPQFKTLIKLADFFGCSLDDFRI